MRNYLINEKEREYILRQLEVGISYPFESKPVLIFVKDIILNLKEDNRGMKNKKISKEHLFKLQEGLKKYRKIAKIKEVLE